MQSTSPSKTTSKKNELSDWKSRMYDLSEGYCKPKFTAILIATNVDPTFYIVSDLQTPAALRKEFFVELAAALGLSREELLLRAAQQVYNGRNILQAPEISKMQSVARTFMSRSRQGLSGEERVKRLSDLQGEFMKAVSGMLKPDDSIYEQFKKDVDRLAATK